jgi:hypothetical protein
MNISTMPKTAFRATSLGALALTILAAWAHTSLAQNITTVPAAAGAILPYFIPEPVRPAAPELMTVNIAGAVFLGGPGEVDMFEIIAGTQQLSDRVLFDNSGPLGTAMITFLSDNEQGNLPLNSAGLPYPPYPLLPVTGLGPEGPLTTTLSIFDTTSTITYTLTATMISDDENNPVLPSVLSDFLGLHAVPTPEPSTVCLAGMGLAALAGMAYRRRRIRRTV